MRKGSWVWYSLSLPCGSRSYFSSRASLQILISIGTSECLSAIFLYSCRIHTTTAAATTIFFIELILT